VCLQLGVLPCVRTHRLSFNPFATSELHHHRGGGASPGDRKGHATSAQKDRYTSARGTRQKLLKQRNFASCPGGKTGHFFVSDHTKRGTMGEEGELDEPAAAGHGGRGAAASHR